MENNGSRRWVKGDDGKFPPRQFSYTTAVMPVETCREIHSCSYYTMQVNHANKITILDSHVKKCLRLVSGKK